MHPMTSFILTMGDRLQWMFHRRFKEDHAVDRLNTDTP